MTYEKVQKHADFFNGFVVKEHCLYSPMDMTQKPLLLARFLSSLDDPTHIIYTPKKLKEDALEFPFIFDFRLRSGQAIVRDLNDD